MAILRTEHISKKFGSLEVLKDINLSVEAGEVICIIGPSGAGKSTYLRSLNQLEKITSGKIFIEEHLFLHRENDRTVEKIAPAKQKEMLLEMGMVFQRFNLFPHKTVLQNVMLAPVKVKKQKPEAAQALALELLKRVGLQEKAYEYPQAHRLRHHVCRAGQAHGGAAPADGIVLRDWPSGQRQNGERRGCRGVGIPASGLSHSRGLLSPQSAPYAGVLRSLRENS